MNYSIDIKCGMRGLWLDICLMVLFLGFPKESRGENFVDSLRREIKLLPDSGKLIRLNELLITNTRNRVYKVYANLLLEEAERQKNDLYKGNALFYLMRYYYSSSPDSLRIYLRQAEPIFIKDRRIEDLCRAKGWNIYTLANENQTEVVLSEVDDLRRLATRFDYMDGVDMANQALAYFYFQSGLNQEGIDLCRESLLGMEKRQVSRSRWFYMLRQLLNKDLQWEYLHKLDSCLKKCEEEKVTQFDDVYSIPYVKLLYHSYMARYYMNEYQPEKAYSHLLMMEELKEKDQIDVEDTFTVFLWIKYYELIEDYDKAFDLAIPLSKNLQDRKRYADWAILEADKANMYYKLGKGMESAQAYRDWKTMQDSLIQNKYREDLAKLKVQRDVVKLEIQNKELALETDKAHARSILLVVGIILLLLFCGALGIFAYSHYRLGHRLRMAKEKAEEADRMKSAFLANMNHEIRTPLNVIVGFSQVLVEEDDRESRRQFANIIQNNNELLQRLIADVLDISKIESKSVSFSYKKWDLPALMKEIESSTSLRMPEGVDLRLDTCEALVFETDRNRLTQILTNLLNNAIKHTSSGFIRFGYKQKGMMVEFLVQDTGEGIPADKVDSIFSRFVKLDDWSTGVGLGLAICRGLVEQMNGKIWVTSKQGEGSSFFVELPLTWVI